VSRGVLSYARDQGVGPGPERVVAPRLEPLDHVLEAVDLRQPLQRLHREALVLPGVADQLFVRADPAEDVGVEIVVPGSPLPFPHERQAVVPPQGRAAEQVVREGLGPVQQRVQPEQAAEREARQSPPIR
jgi:hypothetical protein